MTEQSNETPEQVLDEALQTETASESADTKKKKEKKEYPWYIEIPFIIVVALLVTSLFQSFVGRIYEVPSESMEPTLVGSDAGPNDRIFVNKMSYRSSSPKQGDVIVFAGTPDWNTGYESNRSDNPIIAGLQNAGSTIGLLAPDEHTLVKRVIATGGQTVECREGDAGIKVDGKVLDEPYVMDPPTVMVPDSAQSSAACGGYFFGPITVPKGHLWMMGDNRTRSADSRYHMKDQYQGTIPEDNVVGKVQMIILPLNRIGTVKSVDPTE